MIRTTLLIPLALIACSRTTAGLEREAREKLAPVLFDAESARFSDLYDYVEINGSNRVRTICGRVNAKNKFGAYVGFHRFVVTPESGRAVVSPEAETIASREAADSQSVFDTIWWHGCAEQAKRRAAG